MDEFIDPNLNSAMVKALATSANGSNSATLLEKDVNKIDSQLFQQILENLGDLEAEFICERTRFASSIGVLPAERTKVAQAMANLDLKTYGNDVGSLMAELNKQLAGTKLSYRFSVALINKLPQIVSRFRSIQNGLKNIRLLSFWPLVEQISPLREKYQRMDFAEIQKRMNLLENSLTNISQKPTAAEEMSKLAEETLEKIGYPEIAVKGKDLGALTNSIFNELTACKAVFLVKKDNPTAESELDNLVVDEIALILSSVLR